MRRELVKVRADPAHDHDKDGDDDPQWGFGLRPLGYLDVSGLVNDKFGSAPLAGVAPGGPSSASRPAGWADHESRGHPLGHETIVAWEPRASENKTEPDPREQSADVGQECDSERQTGRSREYSEQGLLTEPGPDRPDRIRFDLSEVYAPEGLTGDVLARSGKQIIDGDSTHFDLIDNDRDLIAGPEDEAVFVAPRRRARIDFELASGQVQDPVRWNARPRIGRHFFRAIPSQ